MNINCQTFVTMHRLYLFYDRVVMYVSIYQCIMDCFTIGTTIFITNHNRTNTILRNQRGIFILPVAGYTQIVITFKLKYVVSCVRKRVEKVV